MEKPLTTDQKLFKPGIVMSKEAWIAPHEGANVFYLYSEGYKFAAQQLYSFCIENPFFNTKLVYPLVFLYRHYLELKLKELILLGFKFLKMENFFPHTHDLTHLWGILKGVLSKVKGINQEHLKSAGSLIKEMDAIDSESFAFRYPFDKKQVASLEPLAFDLENFNDVMERLISFLGSLSKKLEIEDSWLAEF